MVLELTIVGGVLGMVLKWTIYSWGESWEGEFYMAVWYSRPGEFHVVVPNH